MTRSADFELPAGREVEVVQRWSGPHGGYQMGFRILRDEKSVTWSNRYLDAPADASTQQVLLAAMAPQHKGGYSIYISRVVESSDALWAEVSQVGPGEGCNTTMAGTEPMTLAVTPRIDKPVHFVVRPLEMRPCE